MSLTPSNWYDFAILDALDELWNENPARFNLAGKGCELCDRIRRKMRAILTWDDLHARYPSSDNDPIWINRIRTRLGIFKGFKVETPGRKQGWRIGFHGRTCVQNERERFAARQCSDLYRLATSINEQLRREGLTASINMSVDEVVRRCRWDLEPNTFRHYDVWRAFQQGERGSTAFRDAGLVLSFSPDATGQEVERLTFRLDLIDQRSMPISLQ